MKINLCHAVSELTDILGVHLPGHGMEDFPKDIDLTATGRLHRSTGLGDEKDLHL